MTLIKNALKAWGMKMNDYCNGIAYATGCIANDDGKKFLVVRNLDKWYVDNIEKASRYTSYMSTYNTNRDGKPQWVIKARDIRSLPELDSIADVRDFCRAFIEIRGVIDWCIVKGRNGRLRKRLRLRIYGNEVVLTFVNRSLPAGEKKIQHIKNSVDGGEYSGQTCALNYQSAGEIVRMLGWLDGEPKNAPVWDKWMSVVREWENR